MSSEEFHGRSNSLRMSRAAATVNSSTWAVTARTSSRRNGCQRTPPVDRDQGRSAMPVVKRASRQPATACQPCRANTLRIGGAASNGRQAESLVEMRVQDRDCDRFAVPPRSHRMADEHLGGHGISLPTAGQRLVTPFVLHNRMPPTSPGARAQRSSKTGPFRGR